MKYKIVIPFLQAFNHKDIDLEHAAQGSRIDINIGNRIIVETKALGVNLDNCIQQLSNYSGRELPILAILTNGRQFRIYSPQWRQLRSFSDKLMYEFELKDLNNMDFINRLEKILAFSNYESGEFIEHIEEREREIIKAKKEIEEFRKSKTEQLAGLNEQVTDLKNKIQELNEQIRAKEKLIAQINTNKIPEVDDIIKEHFLPIKTSNSKERNALEKLKKIQNPEGVVDNLQEKSTAVRPEHEEIERVYKRMPRWFNSPHQANHKILVTYLE